jgi:hypothetical protein
MRNGIGVFLCLMLTTVRAQTGTFCGERASVPLTVVDKDSGALMHNLAPSAFRIRIDGHDTVAAAMSLPVDRPRFVILVDTSGSMYASDSKWKLARAVAEQAAQTAATEAETSVFTFAAEVSLIPTKIRGNEVQDIQNAFPGKPRARAPTALFDAIAQGAASIENPRPGDALLVITDAGDNRSKTSVRKLESFLISRGIRVSSILLVGGPPTDEEHAGQQELEEVVAWTGGMGMTVVASGLPFAGLVGPPLFDISPKHLAKVLASVNGIVATVIRSQLIDVQRISTTKRQHLKLEYKSSEHGKVELYYPKFLYPCSQ